jgi:hypothetical protein
MRRRTVSGDTRSSSATSAIVRYSAVLTGINNSLCVRADSPIGSMAPMRSFGSARGASMARARAREHLRGAHPLADTLDKPCVWLRSLGASGVRLTCTAEVRRCAPLCGTGPAARSRFASLCTPVRIGGLNRADWFKKG